MMFHRFALPFVIALLALLALLAPQLRADQTAQTFKGKVNDKDVHMGYLLYLPKGYDVKKESSKYPLILFLHGAGERGDDINLVKVHGPPKLADKGKDLPFIVVSPQCPKNTGWNVDTLKALLDDVMKTHRVDADRVYCTGLSMGGFGTWALCSKYPDMFAAAIPICGGGDPKAVAAMKNIPTWVYHGDKDTAVPLKRSQDMVDALKAAGGKVEFTIYPGVGHDSWSKPYGSDELYAWLLKQKREAKP